MTAVNHVVSPNSYPEVELFLMPKRAVIWQKDNVLKKKGEE